ncbi:Asp-tRNA(Asn)/Glu-tRNA(Gln) amidotransferase subunit GatC [Legionella londiniensis]|uniref:Aspartyl/glutamyl-tRNA(Asn/Gln) amidotransferase subunit C n=1 Tax=Legionella londiniensis TaxID=45068 RepID=A0A0W0VNX9_9GAMM|nr:Asp-tRNA(Asn)/Glu-tRNA(Gln) amidotransferase subunit GatC [Legionella londiniensis]KTD21752.1 glutamyl-tRNA(Gln) amidotransferase subunit C [Legionella londiniensis]STX93411.1 glutamyl-tRNA(Gln) amidotransferase subunit C [Legionella londiniensis]
MTISDFTLEQLKKLASIALDQKEENQLLHDLQAIMNFVDDLRGVETKDVSPLHHPLDLHQRLRPDVVTEINHINELAKCAPLFENGLYLVPKVIEV